MAIRKIDLMHQKFGVDENHQCRECFNLIRYRYRSRSIRKCIIYGNTRSQATDWTLSYQACGMFGKEYVGIPIVRMVAPGRPAPQDAPIKGQIGMDDLIKRNEDD